MTDRIAATHAFLVDHLGYEHRHVATQICSSVHDAGPDLDDVTPSYDEYEGPNDYFIIDHHKHVFFFERDLALERFMNGLRD